MKSLIEVFIVRTLVILGMIAFCLAVEHLVNADDSSLIRLREVSVDYNNFYIFNKNARNPITYPDPPKEGLNLNLKIDYLKYFYFNSIVEGLTTKEQYRGVGLNLQTGLRLTSFFEIGLYHHSQHALDRYFESMVRFPVEDALHIKVYLFNRESVESLF